VAFNVVLKVVPNVSEECAVSMNLNSLTAMSFLRHAEPIHYQRLQRFFVPSSKVCQPLE
jgi:hypothetical protein